MMIRTLSLALAVGLGLAVGGLVPQVTHTVQSVAKAAVSSIGASWPVALQAREQTLASLEAEPGEAGHAAEDGHGHAEPEGAADDHGDEEAEGAGDGHGHDEGVEAGGDARGHSEGGEEAEGAIHLSAAQIEAANVEVAAVQAGSLARRLSVPGIVTLNADRVARIPAKVVGTVAELRKRLGDEVAEDEVIAVLESREVAEAKSEYLAAVVNFDLQKTLFEREQSLWEKKITAEQQFLKARATFTEAELQADLARQKLSALDVGEQEATALREPSVTTLRQKQIRSPIAGRVVERLVDLGSPVGGDGQATELYVVADLSSVWVELTVPTSDLEIVQEGQKVEVSTGGTDRRTTGEIVFVSPSLDPETRSARVIAEIENQDLAWRPGSFVTAEIITEEEPVDLAIPQAAVQRLEGSQVVFVRTPEGFEAREITLGRSDAHMAEIVSGLEPGESIAVENTFILKAELGKGEAEHAH